MALVKALHLSEPPLPHQQQSFNTSQDFPGGLDGKVSIYNAGDLGLALGWEIPLEKEMAICSSTIAWKIPWTEEPGKLVYRVAKSRTLLSDFTFTFTV